MDKLYRVLDTEGHFISKFATYNEAYGFKMLANRSDWIISLAKSYSRKPTKRMLKTIDYIEGLTEYTFDGNKEDFQEVFNFIGQYLGCAKFQEEIYLDNIGCVDQRE